MLEYDGQCFYGWQAQGGCLTVQGTLEEAIQKLAGQSARLFAAGRTDRGSMQQAKWLTLISQQIGR